MWEKPSNSGGSSYNPPNQAVLNNLNDSGGALTYKGQIMSGGSMVSPLTGKKWHVLGDSVTRGQYWDNEFVSTPLVEVVTYHQKIATDYGLVVTNYGIGGTRITATGDGQGFCQRYTAMSDTADIVTVFGGINDYAYAGNVPIGTFGSTDTANIYGAMKTLCEGLLQKYPTQKLGFILPFPFNEYKGAGTWSPYGTALKASLEYYSIPYLDLNKNSRLNANIDFINDAYFKKGFDASHTGDRTHPNTRGHAILASKIYNFLLTL